MINETELQANSTRSNKHHILSTMSCWAVLLGVHKRVAKSLYACVNKSCSCIIIIRGFKPVARNFYWGSFGQNVDLLAK